MSMRACQKCNENYWNYKHIEGWIIATCKMCDFEVEFEVKKKKAKPLPLQFKPHKPKKTSRGDSLFLQNGNILNSTQLIKGIPIEIYEEKKENT